MTAGRSIIAASLIFSSLLCFSQGNRINLDVKRVLVTVTVTDKHNRFVQGLKQENFQVWEDKIEQTPIHFSSETTPVTLGIILDKSGSMGGRSLPKGGTAPPSLQDRMISTATSCLREGTREDEYFLLEFSSRPMITTDFTNDISKLGQRLMFMDAGGSTALWDAIYMGVRKLEHASYPRRALLVLTDGMENRSRYSLAELKGLLREEDVRIYSMNRVEVQIDGLAQLSDLTGGRVFRSSSPCKELSADLRNQYVIGYKPTNTAADGAWRAIRVRIRPDGLPKELSDLNVRARKGYYAEQGKP